MPPRKKSAKSLTVAKDDDRNKKALSPSKIVTFAEEMPASTQNGGEEQAEVNQLEEETFTPLENVKQKHSKRKSHKNKRGTKSKNEIQDSCFQESQEEEVENSASVLWKKDENKGVASRSVHEEEVVQDDSPKVNDQDGLIEESDKEGSSTQNSSTSRRRKQIQNLENCFESSEDELPLKKRSFARRRTSKSYTETKDDSFSPPSQQPRLRLSLSKSPDKMSTRVKRQTSILNGSYKLTDNEDTDSEKSFELNSRKRSATKRKAPKATRSRNVREHRSPPKRQRFTVESVDESPIESFNLRNLTVPVEKLDIEALRQGSANGIESVKSDIFASFGISIGDLMRERVPKQKSYKLFEEIIRLINLEAGD